jgi:hypothetical protein
MGVAGIIIASVTAALSAITAAVIMRAGVAPRRHRRVPEENNLPARSVDRSGVSHETTDLQTEATSFSREPGEYMAGADGTRHIHTDPSS